MISSGLSSSDSETCSFRVSPTPGTFGAKFPSFNGDPSNFFPWSFLENVGFEWVNLILVKDPSVFLILVLLLASEGGVSGELSAVIGWV